MSEIKTRKMNLENKCVTYGRDAASTLFGARSPNRLHRRDPHGEEGGIERSFDLQCQRLAEVMGLS